MTTWNVYQGNGNRNPERIKELPAPPPWRDFGAHENENYEITRQRIFIPRQDEIRVINAALCLRRPLLVTGDPGTGKSSLAYAVSDELGLGPVLHWPITSRSTLQEGLYRYDAIGRIHEANLPGGNPSIGKFIQFGPLGSAFLPSDRPRVLLIDEIDKSDIDLPNDLLHIFEIGEFEIPELARLPQGQDDVEVNTFGASDSTAVIHRGKVACSQFPFVVLTSNGERSFPPAFLRRCIRLDIKKSYEAELRQIVEAHFGHDESGSTNREKLIHLFVERRDAGDKGTLATDQLLNAIYLVKGGVNLDKEELIEVILRSLES